MYLEKIFGKKKKAWDKRLVRRKSRFKVKFTKRNYRFVEENKRSLIKLKKDKIN